nr:hypothetical protein [Microcoleus sp. FACHB-672]
MGILGVLVMAVPVASSWKNHIKNLNTKSLPYFTPASGIYLFSSLLICRISSRGDPVSPASAVLGAGVSSISGSSGQNSTVSLTLNFPLSQPSALYFKA